MIGLEGCHGWSGSGSLGSAGPCVGLSSEEYPRSGGDAAGAARLISSNRTWAALRSYHVRSSRTWRLAALVVGAGIGCEGADQVEPRLGLIDLKPDSLELFVGDTASVFFVATDVAQGDVVVESRRPEIVRIEADSLLARAVSQGTTYVVAEATGRARPDSTWVSVSRGPIVECFLTVTPSRIELRVDQTVPLNVSGQDCWGVDSSVLFHSRDTLVATVDTTGMVLAKAPGQTVIVVTVARDTAETATATVNVVP